MQDLHVKSYIVEIAGVRSSIPVAFKQYLGAPGMWNSLVVQRLRLSISPVGGMGAILGGRSKIL